MISGNVRILGGNNDFYNNNPKMSMPKGMITRNRLRRFGTELNANIVREQQTRHNDHSGQNNNKRKRSFNEFHSKLDEQKLDEFEQPMKRCRYNLRSRRQSKKSMNNLAKVGASSVTLGDAIRVVVHNNNNSSNNGHENLNVSNKENGNAVGRRRGALANITHMHTNNMNNVRSTHNISNNTSNTNNHGNNNNNTKKKRSSVVFALHKMSLSKNTANNKVAQLKETGLHTNLKKQSTHHQNKYKTQHKNLFLKTLNRTNLNEHTQNHLIQTVTQPEQRGPLHRQHTLPTQTQTQAQTQHQTLQTQTNKEKHHRARAAMLRKNHHHDDDEDDEDSDLEVIINQKKRTAVEPTEDEDEDEGKAESDEQQQSQNSQEILQIRRPRKRVHTQLERTEDPNPAEDELYDGGVNAHENGKRKRRRRKDAVMRIHKPLRRSERLRKKAILRKQEDHMNQISNNMQYAAKRQRILAQYKADQSLTNNSASASDDTFDDDEDDDDNDSDIDVENETTGQPPRQPRGRHQRRRLQNDVDDDHDEEIEDEDHDRDHDDDEVDEDHLQMQLYDDNSVAATVAADDVELRLSDTDMTLIESRVISENKSQYLECDDRHQNNELYFTSYISNVISFYYSAELETRNSILANYMSFQTDLRFCMRMKLLDWLIDIHRKFKLLDVTLYLTVYILDAYLSRFQINRKRLQLCGCAAMWIACKYHEIYAPQANDFVYMSDDAFSIAEMFEMESHILVKLEFNLSKVTPYSFLERYIQILIHPLYKKYHLRATETAEKSFKFYSELVTDLCHCICEYALFDNNLLAKYKPSLIACSAVCFACLSIGLYSEWPPFLKTNIGYSVTEMRDVIGYFIELRNDKRIRSIRKKYCRISKWFERLDVERTRRIIAKAVEDESQQSVGNNNNNKNNKQIVQCR